MGHVNPFAIRICLVTETGTLPAICMKKSVSATPPSVQRSGYSEVNQAKENLGNEPGYSEVNQAKENLGNEPQVGAHQEWSSRIVK